MLNVSNYASCAISIHAPAKGATTSFRQQKYCLIFQSTLPRRERPGCIDNTSTYKDFNPRSREGSDGEEPDIVLFRIAFQSTLPRRERPYPLRVPRPFGAFQSTLPRRERRIVPIRSRIFCFYFNPRSREGSDKFEGVEWVESVNFNPRSREGSDELMKEFDELEKISIHAPAKGATLRGQFFPHQLKDFNPRSREGSDNKS